MQPHPRLQLRRDLRAGAIPQRRRQQTGARELRDRRLDLPRQLQGRDRIEADRPRRHAVQLAAVFVEGAGTSGRQHARGRLDRARLALQPVIHDRPRSQPATHLGHPLDHTPRVEPRIARLGQPRAARGQKLLPQPPLPAQRRQHAQRPAQLIEQARRRAVPIIVLLHAPQHEPIIARASARAKRASRVTFPSYAPATRSHRATTERARDSPTAHIPVAKRRRPNLRGAGRWRKLRGSDLLACAEAHLAARGVRARKTLLPIGTSC
jgi:hypothetical protein